MHKSFLVCVCVRRRVNIIYICKTGNDVIECATLQTRIPSLARFGWLQPTKEVQKPTLTQCFECALEN
jgi:hypothetical protein